MAATKVKCAIKVTWIQNNGVVRTLENLEPGKSLMEVARDAGVVGILGDCGGACACATCHVYVDPEWMAVVGTPDEIEAATLDGVSSILRSNSRLSCQIQIHPELDGLKVTVAPPP
jgi:2Fe-2S ferredoxin